ncbi:MAG: response regulator [Candidatus Heimdallarchaeaceae archaeon]
MKRLHLIIIEDEGDISNLYKMLFEREGVEINEILYNGQTALDKIEEKIEELENYVYLIDNRIPEKAGIEVAKRLIEIRPQLREQIIIATADDTLTKSEVNELGIPYFLRKPFSLDELLETFAKIEKNKFSNEE